MTCINAKIETHVKDFVKGFGQKQPLGFHSEAPATDGTIAYAVLYQSGGRQSALTFDHPSAAEAMVSLIKAHGCERALAMHGIEIAPRQREAVGQTVAEYIDQHLDALSGVERKTVAEYKRYLTRDIEPVLGQIPLTALTRADISKWVNKLRDDGASGKTCGNKLGFLSGVLNAAVRDGDLPANPAAGIRLPRTVKREMEILTRAEFDILKAADIDRVSGTIRINKAWKRIPDGDADRYELGQPKTRRSTRTISVPDSVLNNLDLNREWVFTNSHGGPIRLYSWRTNVWTKSLAKAKADDPNDPDKAILTKAIRIHDLRHTAASWLLGAGVPLIVVSAHLGHEDTSVTSKIYGHLIPGAGKEAADVMAKLLTP